VTLVLGPPVYTEWTKSRYTEVAILYTVYFYTAVGISEPVHFWTNVGRKVCLIRGGE